MEYIKNFNQWNNDKQKVDKRKGPHVKPGQIWHCKIGINVGREIDGKEGFLRPVLVISRVGNMVYAIPTTSKIPNKYLSFYHEIQSVNFGCYQGGTYIRSFVILSQLKSIDTRRLIKHTATIASNELIIIKNKIIGFVGQ